MKNNNILLYLMQFKNRGFTLIELLVVVLIIGVLAAIALPKYQKAVEKSRAAEMHTILNSLTKAVQSFMLQTGDKNAITINDLDVSIPGTPGTSGTEPVIITPHFRYRAGLSVSASPVPIVVATRVRGGTSLYVVMRLPVNPTSACNDTCCYYRADQQAVCAAIGYPVQGAASCSTSSLGCMRRE